MSEVLYFDKTAVGKMRDTAGLKNQQFKRANNAEQRQPVSVAQSCANKKWIDLYYKYDSDRPVAGANFTLTDMGGKKITSGKLDNQGFAHVAGLSDSLQCVNIFFSGDPKPFDIFNDKKPKANPYYEEMMKAKAQAPPNRFMQAAQRAVELYVAYENMKRNATLWTWEAIKGDWGDDQTLGQIVFDSAVSMIPVIDQAADVRDISANLYKLTVKGEYDKFGPWFGFVMGIIGAIPELGTAIKGTVKCLINVGKDAATFVLKQGVKFGEQLIVKSGIDFGGLIKFMNVFGEGNVVRWLRDQVKKFKKDGEYTVFVKDKMNKILTEIKKACLALKDKVFDFVAEKLQAIADNIEEVSKRAAGFVEEIMGRGGKELDDATKHAEDYSVPGNLMEENGARQIAEGTSHAPAPKPAPVKSHARAKRMTRAEIEKIAKDAGMEPEELMGLIEHCNKTNRRVVVRFTNPKSLQWHGKPNHVPKCVDVKLKTSKSGENAGLVVKPKEPMEDWEIENVNYLKEKGYEFDGAGRLVDPKGNRIYGDYDLQSVHSVDPNTGRSTDLLSNPSESNSVVKEVNGGMGRQDREMLEQRSPVQHGAENDFYVKAQDVPKKDANGNIVLDADGKPVMTKQPVYTKPKHETDVIYDPKSGQVREAPAQGKMIPASKEDIESGRAALGKEYGDDEKYLVVNPDNTTEVLDNPHELYEMTVKNGHPWRYQGTPATGEKLAEEQAVRAEKKHAMENMAAAEAIAEKAQMENFIDDIIGDGKQIWEQPSNYVQIGATPF